MVDKEAAEQRHALERFTACEGHEEHDAVERLRFFCSFAMNGLDWLDAEQFFDAVQKEIAELRGELDALRLAYSAKCSAVEELRADCARMRGAAKEALEGGEEGDWQSARRVLTESLSATDTDYLSRVKAQARSEALEEAADGWCTLNNHSASSISVTLRRMAAEAKENRNG